MFSIIKKEENGFEKIILKNNLTNNYAVIIPACSGMLHEFSIILDDHPFNVIDSYKTYEEFKTRVKENGFKGCKLSPFVCRVKNAQYEFGNRIYHIQKSLPEKHSLHGELYDKSFTILSENANEDEASVSMKYAYRAEDSGYPFNYDCIITWTLEKDNQLSVATQCINKDEGLIPMQDGWHPYFTLGGSVNNWLLEFQAKEMVEFDAELLPTKKLIEYTEYSSLQKIDDAQFDNCFTLNFDTCQPLCVLKNKEKGIELRIFPEKSYPYLQIYIPAERKSIAIENISGAPDAFNNGLGFHTLEPAQTVEFKTTYQINLF